MSNIAILGAGLMGSGMVEAALKRGHSVAVWNRTASKLAPLVKLGARAAASPAEAARGAERVHVILSDDAAVDGALEGLLPALEKGALLVDHTTTAPKPTAARAERLAKPGVEFLHAPVFMSPQNCRDATGLMLACGPAARFERAKPALEQMTGNLWYLGERPDLAAAYKLFGNAMILTLVGGLADVFEMGASVGIKPEEAMQLFGKFKPGNVLDYRGSKMARGNFEPSFELTMARKDLRLMLETAGDPARLAVLPALAARMDDFIARGLGAQDAGVLAKDAVDRARGAKE